MTRRAVLASLVAGLLTVGCQSLPEKDLAAAEALLEQGDLLGTLYRLDRVRPADPDYPRARALAHAIERRVRLSQGLVDRGLQMRAEWRDREAVEHFQQALEVWPELTAAHTLLSATRARLDALDASPDVVVDVSPGDLVVTQPVERVPNEATNAAPLLESAPGSEESLPLPVRPDLVDLESRLAVIERKLDEGFLEPALVIAESTGQAIPAGLLRRRLVEMLHQRALVHYGHGALALALRDWTRLLKMEPRHREAKKFASAARAELAVD